MFFKQNDEGFEKVRDFEKLLFGGILILLVITVITVAVYTI